MTGTGLLFLIAGMALLAWLMSHRACDIAGARRRRTKQSAFLSWLVPAGVRGCAAFAVPRFLVSDFARLGHQYGAF